VRVRIHYATLGMPRRGSDGQINNAVLLLHWTGSDGRPLLTPAYMKALFDPGRPLDFGGYYLIFPDSICEGCSGKPSDRWRMQETILSRSRVWYSPTNCSA
jgi:homoserine O-acetyltransferase